MQMGGHRARTARPRVATHPVLGSLTGFELFILGLIVAMVVDVGLFVWLIAREFAR